MNRPIHTWGYGRSQVACTHLNVLQHVPWCTVVHGFLASYGNGCVKLNPNAKSVLPVKKAVMYFDVLLKMLITCSMPVC